MQYLEKANVDGYLVDADARSTSTSRARIHAGEHGEERRHRLSSGVVPDYEQTVKVSTL